MNALHDCGCDAVVDNAIPSFADYCRNAAEKTIVGLCNGNSEFLCGIKAYVFIECLFVQTTYSGFDDVSSGGFAFGLIPLSIGESDGEFVMCAV